MPSATFHFPRGFLWGTATSSHQVEGNNKNNNWAAWEQEPGRIAEGHTAGLACDWWGGRWREDFDRAAESGQNAHRLSIEWSRIQPAPDRWDEDALDHYREMVRGLHERDITPLVTLHHFTDPLWLAEMGGWENEEVATRFEAYTAKVVEALKGYVTLWCTINEPNILAVMGYLFGVFPPGKTDLNTSFAVMTNLVKAHAAAYHSIHRLQPEARVGLALHWRGFEPARNWFPPDRFLVRFFSRLFNDFFPQAFTDGTLKFINSKLSVPQAAKTQDFLGLNYYSTDSVAFDPRSKSTLFAQRACPPDAEVSPNGFTANVPEGFFQAVKWGLNYKLPIIVTENGTEDSADDFRRRYLVEHVHQLWHAVNFNYPVKAYFHWSLVDNFEWDRGWTQRFGLWELDKQTQARRKRPSADLYAAICRENGLSSEVVAEYAPEVFGKLFPG